MQIDIIDKFVTAKLKGLNECRQGVVLDTDTFKIIGINGDIYYCEGCPVIVENPPDNCILCGKPSGKLCVVCKKNLKILFDM